MNTLILLFILIAVNISGTFIGWLLTEHYPTRIARLEWLNFKPFSCRKCFTGWYIIIINITIGIIIGSWIYAVIGVLFGLFTTLALHFEDKKYIQP